MLSHSGGGGRGGPVNDPSAAPSLSAETARQATTADQSDDRDEDDDPNDDSNKFENTEDINIVEQSDELSSSKQELMYW